MSAVAPSLPTAEPLTVMGAGLVGSLLSLYLARRGHPVQVFERRADPRRAGFQEGRSINLALSDRGWRALEGVGVADDIRQVGIPMTGRVMHDVQGNLTRQPYGQADQAIYSVNRGHLNRRLLDLAEAQPNVRLHFGQQCLGIDLKAQQLHLLDTATQQEHTEPYSRLFGTDGAFSAVRSALQKTDRYDYSQDYLEYGYKELTIEAGPQGTWQLEKNALHIWPRGQYLMIALPNLDGSFNCTLFFPYEGPESFAALQTPADVTAFFTRVFADAVPLMPALTQEFFEHPTGSLVTIRCFPWKYDDDVLLLGDASHAIVPFYGQGMNAGFEDCSVLNALLDQYGDAAWPTIFNEFQAQRKPNTDAMADLALYNFTEMRDRVADPRFLLQKKIEARISSQYPGRWTPLYSQVTFSHTPYAEAWAAGQRQDAIMARLMPHIQTEADFDQPAVQELVRQEMAAQN
ncbi:NAD(P)/FAD-dependent oxidoreductase [Hymenobacter sp. BT770]|uniref:FAD-dependent oxidoreductase n=1 Tax=Hymenobacter sp. BT770 TaxID=2886942 RepID=UPI001D109BD6|nr:NAD(P)/FAD-dependent oxidoreductase [Hymenobacter sp. BT770]MCC3154095.1 FAD-dependent monooxygenase [Hymenobacter sp. BT770]MDO3416239.1 NAD(P)/FAD-dependent oxidoreductase [Hymenobacter sp. BT770]